jgi:hypothetical protein
MLRPIQRRSKPWLTGFSPPEGKLYAKRRRAPEPVSGINCLRIPQFLLRRLENVKGEGEWRCDGVEHQENVRPHDGVTAHRALILRQ